MPCFRRLVCASACLLSLAWAVRQHVPIAEEAAAAAASPSKAHLIPASTGPKPVDLAEMTVVAKIHALTADFREAFFKSFTMMCVAEIFDRTWFVTLICALNYGSVLSFTSSLSALFMHTIMAVSFGETVAYMMPRWYLELASAIILGVLAIQFAWECYQARADQDAIKNRREEAQEDVDSAEASTEASSSPEPEKAAASAGRTEKSGLGFWQGFATVFTMIFLAEWGDRTQIVQITLAASLPPLGVICGSFAGLILLAMSACVLARFVDSWEISERVLNAVCAVSFGIMAGLAIYNTHAGHVEAHHL